MSRGFLRPRRAALEGAALFRSAGALSHAPSVARSTCSRQNRDHGSAAFESGREGLSQGIGVFATCTLILVVLIAGNSLHLWGQRGTGTPHVDLVRPSRSAELH